MIYIYYRSKVFKNVAKHILSNIPSSKEIYSLDITDDKSIYIILGANQMDINIDTFPKNYIVYQLEQSSWTKNHFSKNYIDILAKAQEIWDYSLVNIKYLTSLPELSNIKMQYIPLMYQSNVKKSKGKKDIDVLFYGSLSDRRLSIINELKEKTNLKIVSRANIWGKDLDDLIDRSKVILNLHYYNIEESILEIERISYLCSKGKIVISERSSDAILDKLYQKYIIFSDNILETVNNYFSNVKEFNENFFNTKTNFNITNYSKSDNHIEKKEITLHKAQTEKDEEGNLVLKLKNVRDEELPHVSLVTITYNRAKIFKNALRNFYNTEYPEDKLEWIIVDDSENDELSGIIPNDPRIKYYHITEHLTVGKKRNIAIEKTSTDYIIFMDDDDYYPSCSVYSRVKTLLSYPNFDLVGTNELIMHDMFSGQSAIVKGNSTYISEASMGFKKSFWMQRKFPEDSLMGEGSIFCKDRYNKIIVIPSFFIIFALTHGNNLTGNNRRITDMELDVNILTTLTMQTRLFLEETFSN